MSPVAALAVLLVTAALAVGEAALAGGAPHAALAGLAVAIQVVAWAPSALARSERAYDLVGGLTFLVVSACAVAIATSAGTLGPRGALLAALVATWALRLGLFLVQRVREVGHDRRFDALKVDPWRFLVPWSLQGLWVTTTSLGAVAAVLAPDVPLGPLDVVGLGVWALGFGVEVVADAQKSAFRRDPANAGRFIDQGLWSRSRHPNYLGEITLWWGVALLAVPALGSWAPLALVSPLFVTALLLRVSGVPLLERSAEARWGHDPAWRAYVARTGRLLPRLGR